MLNSGNASTVATTTAGQAESGTTVHGNSANSGSNVTKQLVMTQSGQDSKSKEKGTAQQVSSFVAISNQK